MTPNDLSQTVDAVCATIEATKVSFEAIAFTGASGLLIAPSVAMRLNKQMMLIRKNKDSCHSNFSLEGYVGGGNYIIIDDCIDSGSTIERIDAVVGRLQNEQRWTMESIFLYNPFERFVGIEGLMDRRVGGVPVKVWDCRMFMPELVAAAAADAAAAAVAKATPVGLPGQELVVRYVRSSSSCPAQQLALRPVHTPAICEVL